MRLRRMAQLPRWPGKIYIPVCRSKSMLSTLRILFIILFSFSVLAIGCDPLIRVRGNVDELVTQRIEGQVADGKERAVPGVRVVLRAKENPSRGFKATTNETGSYEISGIITALKSGWNWSEGWELVFEKEGYKTTIVELDPKKHKDSEGNLKWGYRVDTFISPNQ